MTRAYCTQTLPSDWTCLTRLFLELAHLLSNVWEETIINLDDKGLNRSSLHRKPKVWKFCETFNKRVWVCVPSALKALKVDNEQHSIPDARTR